MRASVLVLTSLALASLGCAGRYNSLRSGEYICTATVASNTCAEVVPTPSSYPSTLQGGGSDTFSIELPSQVSRFNGEVGGETMQFGAQANSMSYFVTSGVQCTANNGSTNPGRVASVETDAQLVTVGTDAVDVRVTHRYPDFSTCTETSTTSGPCELVFDVHCAKAP